MGIADSLGIPAELANLTTVIPYNSSERVRRLFEQEGEQFACIIVEPIAGNMNFVFPTSEFLQTLRDCCNKIHFIDFDEVMTGFRVALGGAQSLYNITPDLTTFGKVIGGGMPIGAFGGRKEIMQHIAPEEMFIRQVHYLGTHLP